MKLFLNDGKEPPELLVKTFDVSLVLYAEHDFNASTFAARTTVSTLSDFYSAICTGIGTLRGPLHGGANEAAIRFQLLFKTKEEATKRVREMFSKKEVVMGFGHRVYQKGDPRSNIIKDYSRQLSETKFGDKTLFEIACHIEEMMLNEKKIYPNLDWFSASAYHQCGIPVDFFTPIFVISRMSGWSAHIIEQRKQNKLIRPQSKYTGPAPKTFTKLSLRAKL